MKTQNPRSPGQPPVGDLSASEDAHARQKPSETMGEAVDKAVHGEDEPMERSAPAAPFALVALAYLAILAIAALGIAAVVWWL